MNVTREVWYPFMHMYAHVPFMHMCHDLFKCRIILLCTCAITYSSVASFFLYPITQYFWALLVEVTLSSAFNKLHRFPTSVTWLNYIWRDTSKKIPWMSQICYAISHRRSQMCYAISRIHVTRMWLSDVGHRLCSQTRWHVWPWLIRYGMTHTRKHTGWCNTLDNAIHWMMQHTGWCNTLDDATHWMMQVSKIHLGHIFESCYMYMSHVISGWCNTLDDATHSCHATYTWVMWYLYIWQDDTAAFRSRKYTRYICMCICVCVYVYVCHFVACLM